MLCKTHFYAVAVLAGSFFILGARAAEAPPANGADAKTKALEERVQALEKRLADMESRATAPSRRGWKDNTDELFERMRREMMESGGAFDWNNMFGQNPGLRPQAGRKPMLGVGVDQVSDELKTRYKNEVKEGAFVVSVYPDSPAQKAGILEGDAITQFDGKSVTTPQALIEAVKAATKGEHEVLVSRRGESLMLKVKLASDEPPGLGLDPLRKRDGALNRSRTEIHVSALELSDTLAKDLKLSDDQKKKMNDILANHAKALSDEFSQNSKSTHRRGDVFGFTVNGNLTELAKKHADDAAKDLAGVLSPEQLKEWNDYRTTHSSVSFSQSMQMGEGFPGGQPFKLEEDEEKVTF